MPEYKLTYFNSKGKAELIRYLFALAGVEYEDIRIEKDDWPSKKEGVNPPFGQVPILSIDGIVYAQAISIARYLAEQFGYAGKTDLDKLRADMIVHYCEDLLGAILKIFIENDEQKKAEVRNKFLNEALKTFFTNFEKILKQNKDGDGFFVGDSITWADLAVFQYINFIQIYGDIDFTSSLGSYPKLSALLQRVQSVPQIAAWIAKRPSTRY